MLSVVILHINQCPNGYLLYSFIARDQCSYFHGNQRRYWRSDEYFDFIISYCSHIDAITNTLA